MENQELKHYIDAQLAGGTAPDELKKLLMHHGWAPEIVDAHMPGRPLASPALVAIKNENAVDSSPYIDDRKKRKWGIFFIVLPFASLLLILIAYAIAQFAISNLVASAPSPALNSLMTNGDEEIVGLSLATKAWLAMRDQHQVTASILSVGLSLLGMLSVLGIFIFIPIGTIMIARSRRTLKPGIAFDERSGQGAASVMPPEAGGWNWGAAFFNIWWGIYYRVWFSFLVFVPVVNWFWWIVLGIKGNEWAWQNNKWLSVEEFKTSQNKWRPWAIAIIVLNILILIFAASMMVKGMAPSATYPRY